MINKSEWPMVTVDDLKDEKFGNKKRTLFGYFGAKWYLLDVIYALMPEHVKFFDTCGGSGVVTINNYISQQRVINEIDPELFNLYRLIKSDRWSELQDKLLLSPASSSHYRENLGRMKKEINDEIEKVGTFYDVMAQVYGGNPTGTGWANIIGTRAELSYYRKIANFEFFHQRLKDVEIQHMDLCELLKGYDNPEHLFYLDPPYAPETRKGGTYRYDMPPEKHDHILSTLVMGNGKYIVSGYNSDRYNKMLRPPKWNKLEIPAKLHIACVRASQGEHKEDTLECFWYNYQLSAEAAAKVAEIKRKAESRIRPR